MENKLASFHTRLKIWIPPLFIMSLIGGAIFFLVILIESSNIREGINFSLLLSALIFGFLSILFVIVNYTYKVTIFTNGISSYDPFGSWKCDFMKFDAMENIKRKNIIGVKYFLIESSKSGARLWIPIELIKKHDFIRHIGENAGMNHPLYVKLLKTYT